jgi:hypothetical protein
MWHRYQKFLGKEGSAAALKYRKKTDLTRKLDHDYQIFQVWGLDPLPLDNLFRSIFSPGFL